MYIINPDEIEFQSAPPRGRRLAWKRPCPQLSCFNPRLRVGGDSAGRHRMDQAEVFQSAPPRGRRLDSSKPMVSTIWFQSAPPRGRRHIVFMLSSPFWSFNPRLRVGGDSNISLNGGKRLSFNPRLRVGGDRYSDLQYRAGAVSIRASAWEATGTRPRSRCSRSFNPRLRVGGDRPVPRSTCQALVSIRASAWEATGVLEPPARDAGVSIRASAWEATASWSRPPATPEFQSAPPRGRRL